MESRRELTDAEVEHQQKQLEENKANTPAGVKDTPPVPEAEPAPKSKSKRKDTEAKVDE